jgi:hypothetical protein
MHRWYSYVFSHNQRNPQQSTDATETLVVVVVASEFLLEDIKVLEVFFVNFGEGDAGSSLLVDKFAKACLSLNEAERNTLLSAQSWQEDEEFNGVDVVSHNNELSLTIFNELGNVVETILEDNRLGGLLGISTTLLALGSRLESDLLLSLSFGLVFSKQFKELRS